MENDLGKPGQVEKNERSVLTTIQSGHVLADHSYGHMYQNSMVFRIDTFLNLALQNFVT